MNISNRRKVFNGIKYLMLISFTLNVLSVSAKKSSDEEVDISKTPHRIIRACCAFGYDLKLWGLPFISIDQVIDVEDLGAHHYMGKKSEGVGTIYTKRGGFIDIGHLRDQIDWTRYLYSFILDCRGKGEVILPLSKEGGQKNLYFNIPDDLDSNDCILLAGKITYDLSLWHELSTWFGASVLPMMTEQFSSFSVEDVYSNLLGVHVGIKTLHSKLPFNQAATNLIRSTLDSLDVVKTTSETYKAYDAINNIWYTNEKRLPSPKVTIMRDTDVLTHSRPWIIPDTSDSIDEPVVLEVPLLDTKGDLLTNYYQLTIDLNNKFPVEEMFSNCEGRVINQDDFGVLLNRVSNELHIAEQCKIEEEK